MTDKLHFRVRYPNGYELEFSGSRIEVGKYFEEIMQKEKAKTAISKSGFKFNSPTINNNKPK